MPILRMAKLLMPLGFMPRGSAGWGVGELSPHELSYPVRKPNGNVFLTLCLGVGSGKR
jgi:hypothetical protein